MAAHPVVHVDLASNDPKGAGRFYADLFGWRLEHDQPSDYLMFHGDGGPGGGFIKAGYAGTEAGGAVVYVGSEDIDATLRRVEELGGTIEVPKTEIPGAGAFSIVRDPVGGRVGLYQAPPPQPQA